MNTFTSRRNRAGFTMAELIVSIAILAIMALAIAQILSSTAQITVVNGKHADANSQARMVFDRMETDFSRMVKRSDVDYIFYKGLVAGVLGTNDTMFFYSEAASYFPNTATYAFFSAAPYKTTPYAYKDSVSLIGYRINNSTALPNFSEMERLGRPLTWDSTPAYSATSLPIPNSYPAPVVFLTYPTPPATTTQLSSPSSPFCGNPHTSAAYSSAVFNSTLAGAFSANGTTPTPVGTEFNFFNDGGSDSFNASFYRPIGTQVFRFEYSFQLRDGTESGIPVMNASTTGDPNNVPTSNLTATSPPAASNDSTGGYAVGSRWYDTTNQIGYICLDASPGEAVWHEIGLQDISAIVVTIAIMDNQGLVLLRNRGTLATVMPLLEAALADGTSSAVAQTWQTALTPVSGVSPVATATGIPQPIVSQIRVYQRYFYINNL